MEDLRLKKLRELRDQAALLQDGATKLVTEITDQIQRSIFLHDDRGTPPERRRAERRKKPRS